MLKEAQRILAANRIERDSEDFNQCLMRASLGFLRTMFFTLENAPSMGEKSGE